MVEERYNIDQRRLRANPHIRELVSTVTLSHKDFIQPLFVDEGTAQRTPITTLNGIHSETIESAIRQIGEDINNGVTKFLLFPVPKEKGETDFDFSFPLKAVRDIKSAFGDRIWLAADVCLCAFTTHGHCGILNPDRTSVLNDETVKTLAHYAYQLAQSGADCIAPSDLMDGRVKAIRASLNKNGYDHIAIMSYSAKFSSAFYGPFRDACKSVPGKDSLLRDRKTYQLSPFNSKDAMRTALRDGEEGADILMIKPALLNVDILRGLRSSVQLPLAAYHVSGEYQSIELLAQQNSIQRDKAHIEVWTTLKRAGADAIISYASRFAKEWIEKIEY